MSDAIAHECGIAAIRLLKPLSYYADKYGSPLYGFNQLFLLMEKQHNRGQDGAGIGSVKLDMPCGSPYMFRERCADNNPLAKVFRRQLKAYDRMVKGGTLFPELPDTVKEHFAFGGEVLMGHMRYGTSGSYDESCCHPYVRRSNWLTKNLLLAGNFNITNVESLNQGLAARGQMPIYGTDTNTLMEEVGYQLDEEHTRLFHLLRDEKGLTGPEIAQKIDDQLDMIEVLRRAATNWDGGYCIAGAVGNGDLFVLRDPNGIRPCFYFRNEEVVAFASERVPLMTIFGVEQEEVMELPPGQMMLVKKDGSVREGQFREPLQRKSCSFEHVYFSRGNDARIYQSRKNLGAALVPQILGHIDHDLQHSVFSFIPNTAEVGYYGLMDELDAYRRGVVRDRLLDALAAGQMDEALIDELIMRNWPRAEKVAHKDIKLRTFISQEKKRTQMASHVYDITYGVVTHEDHLVVIDDSIVRGTTLRQSILKILSRTRPKSIVIASTAPQIRYPDCYGIDMSELGKFIAFQAAVNLIRETGKSELMREVYQECLAELEKPEADRRNPVKKIYQDFTAEEISNKIASMVYPQCDNWSGDVQVVYQSIENLHAALPPEHHGDWYFTGNYPTAGGYTVINKAYINYYENREGRSY